MLSHVVRDFVDVLHVQRMTKSFAASLGFPSRACSELAIVASELSSNILKYGVTGSIELIAVNDAAGAGICLIAHDMGPPFRNLEQALQDGWDDNGPIDPLRILNRKGMGGGLGAVVRLSDRVQVEPEPGGKRVLVLRYLKPPVSKLM
jgi:anti-sigma regulatory factor (Ser/Thr protein kinase)